VYPKSLETYVLNHLGLLQEKASAEFSPFGHIVGIYAAENTLEFALGKNFLELVQWQDLIFTIIYKPHEATESLSPQALRHLVHTTMNYVLQQFENNFHVELAFSDDLTNVFNYRKLCVDLTEMLKSELPFVLVFIDINDFKSVNDQYGHLVGSSIIGQLAKRLREKLSPETLIYRYGGDEFVLLFPKSTEEDQKNNLENLTQSIEERPFFINEQKTLPMKITYGVAEYPHHGRSLKEILHVADLMMYSSKKSGRKKIISSVA
jgi:diguanylate cyclase (GGDEF)-like protein